MRRGLRWVVSPAVALGLASCAATDNGGYGYYANYPDYGYPGDFYSPASGGIFLGRGLRHDRHHDFAHHEGHHDRNHAVGAAAAHEGGPHHGMAAHGGHGGGHHH